MPAYPRNAVRQRSREEWRGVLRSLGIRPERSMGQNFLTDPDVVSAIVDVAGIDAGDRVVEVGPGLGILTRALLGAGATVVSVELDRELAAFLRHDLHEVHQFSLIEADARFVDLPKGDDEIGWHLVANLPYSTGTVILRHLLESSHPPVASTVMVQKEVAERMAATVPDMSLLALAVQVFTVPELKFVVPPDVFEPPPKVESAVVQLVRRPLPLLNEHERSHLFDLAAVAFRQKRKTLANSLATGLGRPKGDVEDALRAVGIDPGGRPQAIDLDQWCVLARSELAA